jgi:hypothetical protein
MKFEELRNHIKGSHLMGHDLEAFLIQSAYLEGLLKRIADYHLFSQTEGKTYKDKLLVAIKDDVEKYSLFDLIDLLERGGIITKEEAKALDNYRKKRNSVLHDLLRKSSSSTFDQEMKDVYVIGEKVMDSKEFKDMEEMSEEMEKG